MDFEGLQTKRELDNLIQDFKRFNTVFRFVSLGVYILFLIYSLVVGAGNLPLTIFLLCLTIAYTAFAAVCTVKESKGENVSKADKTVAKIYRYAKLAATLLSALLSIFGILTAVEHTTPLSIVLAILLPVCLVLQIILELVIVAVTKRVKRFQTALTHDLDILKRDMVKIALGLVKDAIFKRRKEEDKSKGSIEEDEDGEIIVVGSDLPVSAKEMKRVGEKTKGKRENIFQRAFKKLFKPKKEKNQPSVLEDIQPENE